MTRVVEIRGLGRHFTAAGGVLALKNISLDIETGEFLAIMGASGSGKSTLLHILGLLDTPTSGSYLLDGTDVGQLSSRRRSDLRCRKIGIVFQNFGLLPRSSVLENVELPLIYAGTSGRRSRKRVCEVLEAVGLAHRMRHLPHQLSGGEQQRVAVARALANDPKILLADEPTGALDSETGLTILNLFEKLNRSGHTIVMVTHDSGIARRAGRIVRLKDGAMLSDIGNGPFVDTFHDQIDVLPPTPLLLQ